ncbi:hypothetical protein C8E89_13317 [Mycolicibacterium moriokaense]|uniref:Uncharacterized protein n=1 Tax=Mycolicibacterium moriokaense TaxID=39691 RepID=A0A318HIK3_9MYCO|nr:hypothetical protein C8E89_13317 [Mycolicibacterium moriokaense]
MMSFSFHRRGRRSSVPDIYRCPPPPPWPWNPPPPTKPPPPPKQKCATAVRIKGGRRRSVIDLYVARRLAHRAGARFLIWRNAGGSVGNWCGADGDRDSRGPEERGNVTQCGSHDVSPCNGDCFYLHSRISSRATHAVTAGTHRRCRQRESSVPRQRVTASCAATSLRRCPSAPVWVLLLAAMPSAGLPPQVCAAVLAPEFPASGVSRWVSAVATRVS